MLKKSIYVLIAAAFVICTFTACQKPADTKEEKAVENFTVTSDYSQISVNWESEGEKGVTYYVYASKDNNTSKLTEENDRCYNRYISNFSVDEPGHYYVWVRTGAKGPFSKAKEVDVTFVGAVSNIHVTPTIVGIDVSWTSPEDADHVTVAYKKIDADEWQEEHYDVSVTSCHLNSIDDGEYVFKLIAEDAYLKGVESEVPGTYTFTFDSTRYGKKPDGISELKPSNVIKEFPEDTNTLYYYYYCEKGKTYRFNIFDDPSYTLARLSKNNWTGTNLKLAKVNLYIYIAGSCPVSKNDSSPYVEGGCVASKEDFTSNSYELWFRCGRDGYYVVQIIRDAASKDGNYQYGLNVL